MSGLTPYQYIAGTLALMTILGVAMHWYHKRESTTAQAKRLADQFTEFEKEMKTNKEQLHALELKLVTEFMRREDLVVAFTKLEHKIDKLAETITGTQAARQ